MLKYIKKHADMFRSQQIIIREYDYTLITNLMH